MPTNRYHHGNLRQALIDAALETADAEGIAAIKVSALARSLGVSSAAPFRHFADRDALLVAAAEQAARSMMAAMQAAISSEPDPGEAQLAGGVAYVLFCAAHPGWFHLISRANLLGRSETLKAMSDTYTAQLEPIVGKGHEQTASPELKARSVGVLAAQAAAYGIAGMAVDGFFGDITPDELATVAREVLSTLGS